MPLPDHVVSLRDIARRAGVSKMTVSLALRGHPHAAAATRDRLRRLARQMGYRPNPLIVANMVHLRAGRRSRYSGTLAFIGLGPRPLQGTGRDHIHRVYRGARRRAETLGYHLEWFSLGGTEPAGRRLSDILQARGILGVVLGANRILTPPCHL